MFQPDAHPARAVDRAPELKKRHVILPPAFCAGYRHNSLKSYILWREPAKGKLSEKASV
jgi:hypothetical protein